MASISVLKFAVPVCLFLVAATSLLPTTVYAKTIYRSDCVRVEAAPMSSKTERCSKGKRYWKLRARLVSRCAADISNLGGQVRLFFRDAQGQKARFLNRKNISKPSRATTCGKPEIVKVESPRRRDRRRRKKEKNQYSGIDLRGTWRCRSKWGGKGSGRTSISTCTVTHVIRKRLSNRKFSGRSKSVCTTEGRSGKAIDKANSTFSVLGDKVRVNYKITSSGNRRVSTAWVIYKLNKGKMTEVSSSSYGGTTWTIYNNCTR